MKSGTLEIVVVRFVTRPPGPPYSSVSVTSTEWRVLGSASSGPTSNAGCQFIRVADDNFPFAQFVHAPAHPAGRFAVPYVNTFSVRAPLETLVSRSARS